MPTPKRRGVPPDPQVVGLYITACASGTATGDKTPNSVPTIERRLSSLTWNYAQRGQPLDRKDRHIATVMAGIRNKHGASPRQKEAILTEDLIAMLETLERGGGLRDRAMLLLGFAGGLRRSEIVALDIDRDQTEDGRGWIETLDKGMLVSLRGKTAGGRSKSGAARPMPPARLSRCRPGSSSPVSRTDRCSGALPAKARRSAPIGSMTRRLRAWSSGPRWRPACAATCRKGERRKLFSGHSLRAGLASSTEVDERYLQKQLGRADISAVATASGSISPRRVACRRSGKSPPLPV
ncbi:MAG: hypothetical protein E5W26_00165 [Mesorhizobium sp.]|nr:MAG: hypothetical protein E5W26_00165 [Mesorhizobium sp.]TIV62407.1 MAG: hypothetical protein E5V80_00680 [Mesorhizobium sp.]